MTNKQRILRMIEKWPDDISFAKALYHMHVLKSIEEGLQDVREGNVIDHDELFNRLLNENENNHNTVVGKSRKKSTADRKVHRPGRAQDGAVLHKTSKKVRE